MARDKFRPVGSSLPEVFEAIRTFGIWGHGRKKRARVDKLSHDLRPRLVTSGGVVIREDVSTPARAKGDGDAFDDVPMPHVD